MYYYMHIECCMARTKATPKSQVELWLKIILCCQKDLTTRTSSFWFNHYIGRLVVYICRCIAARKTIRKFINATVYCDLKRIVGRPLSIFAHNTRITFYHAQTHLHTYVTSTMPCATTRMMIWVILQWDKLDATQQNPLTYFSRCAGENSFESEHNIGIYVLYIIRKDIHLKTYWIASVGLRV